MPNYIYIVALGLLIDSELFKEMINDKWEMIIGWTCYFYWQIFINPLTIYINLMIHFNSFAACTSSNTLFIYALYNWWSTFSKVFNICCLCL